VAMWISRPPGWLPGRWWDRICVRVHGRNLSTHRPNASTHTNLWTTISAHGLSPAHAAIDAAERRTRQACGRTLSGCQMTRAGEIHIWEVGFRGHARLPRPGCPSDLLGCCSQRPPGARGG
jgi:hypothetical protein